MRPKAVLSGAGRPWLAWKRYADARGNVLAAGVGYFAFFSVFPAVALAFAVFGFVLRGHPDLLASVFDQLGGYLPGLIKDGQHTDGLLEKQDLAPPAAALTITGVLAFAALVLGGLGWLGATREGIRAVFGVPGSAGNLLTNKVRDLGVLFTLGLGIAVFAVLTTGVGTAADWSAERSGLFGLFVALAGFVVGVLADTCLMIILLRVVSGLNVPWRDLSRGALLGGVGLSLLKLSAGILLPRLTANPLFASFAIVVGLLVWLNLIARLTLISAAWAANDVDEIRAERDRAQTDSLRPSSPTATRDPSLPTFGARSADRSTLGAGVILGVAAMAATGALARGIRSVVRLARG